MIVRFKPLITFILIIFSIRCKFSFFIPKIGFSKRESFFILTYTLLYFEQMEIIHCNLSSLFAKLFINFIWDISSAALTTRFVYVMNDGSWVLAIIIFIKIWIIFGLKTSLHIKFSLSFWWLVSIFINWILFFWLHRILIVCWITKITARDVWIFLLKMATQIFFCIITKRI